MSNLLSQDQAALKMLFTDDIYHIHEEKTGIPVQLIKSENSVKIEDKVQPEINIPVKETTIPIQIVNNKTILKVEESPEVNIPVKTDFEYQGDNNKYFLVLIDDKIHTRMNPVHLEMLLKVMNAKKLELRDLAILNINRYSEAKFNELKSFFSCSKLVLFGVSPAQIGLPSISLNKAGSAGSVKVLATYGLEDMRNNADKKREFWNIMKNF